MRYAGDKMTEKAEQAKKEIEAIRFAEIKLENEREDRVCTPLDLWDGRNTAIGYADVSWESSDPAEVSLSGEVRCGREPKPVTLTACFTYQDHPEIALYKSFSLTVLAGSGRAVQVRETEPGRAGADTTAVFIAGDSTASAYPHSGENNRYPQTGWGQMLQRYFDPAEALVVNYAMSGRSSKSFRTEDRYGRLGQYLRPGDYLIIQFGHNDSKREDPKRYTSLSGGREREGSFQNSLMQFIRLARERGAVPVLATPISRLAVSDDTLEKYAAAIRELGRLERVPVLDLYARTNGWIRSVGLREARTLFKIIRPYDPRFLPNPEFQRSQYLKGDEDFTHLNQYGADLVAKWVCGELREKAPELGAMWNGYQPVEPLPRVDE